jgi:uncharacterized RDD family membrane protein YckC
MQSGPFPPDRPPKDEPEGAGPGPEAPAGPQAPPGYGGPVPPGGWQQPVARPQGWVGVPLATWGTRACAYLIDALILLVPAVVIFFTVVAGAVGISGGDDDVAVGAVIGALVLWAILMAAIALLYAPLLMARQGAHNGQTWGKQLLGIRVVRDSGESMGFGWAALREIVVKGLAVGIASSIVPFLPWLLDNLWPLWDDQNRALHDMVVSTHVVRA